ncbi:DUF3718 domain-containing protein [Aliikangiella sp. IMCC44359]|uniref:DUF3718 domain-containing protein n=1 Tax=Aliikangiella sp. IMCC44359 TaxID=3459125 RepID=UPI00403AE37D
MRIKQTLLTLIGTTVIIGSASAAEKQYKAVDDSRYTRLCMVAADGNKLQFVKAIKDSGFSNHYVANEVTCNGIAISEFVQQEGNKANQRHLNKFIEKKVEVTRVAKN